MNNVIAKFTPVIPVENEPATLDPLQQFTRNWDELTPTQRAILLGKSNDFVNTNRRAAMIRVAASNALSEAQEINQQPGGSNN